MTGSVDGMRYLYLDMNCWVQMARGVNARSARWREVVAGLMKAVEGGFLTVPLSAAHYLELWHRGDADSREQIGALMRDMSRYTTLLAFDALQRLEIDAFVAAWLGDERRVSATDVVGWGADHAFSSPHGRFRFVQNIETEESDEGPAVAPPVEFGQLRDVLGDLAWEWFQLVGDREFNSAQWLDRTPEHRFGTRDQEEENRIRALLANDPATMRRLDDLTRYQEFVRLTDTINRICVARRIDPYGLFHETIHPTGIAGAVREFGKSVPTVHVRSTLRAWKHRDFTHPWDQHDRTDLLALAVATPYCDWVVTERRWVHLANASGLAQAYGTKFGAGVSALEEGLTQIP